MSSLLKDPNIEFSGHFQHPICSIIVNHLQMSQVNLGHPRLHLDMAPLIWRKIKGSLFLSVRSISAVLNLGNQGCRGVGDMPELCEFLFALRELTRRSLQSFPSAASMATSSSLQLTKPTGLSPWGGTGGAL